MAHVLIPEHGSLMVIARGYKTVSLGQKIKEARLAKGWRQHNLADALGVTVQAVSQWERDANHPGLQRVFDIASAMDKDFRDFVREYSPEDDEILYRPPNPIPIISNISVFDFVNDKDILPVVERTTGSSLIGQGKLFGIEISSDSMEPLLIPGDLAIFDLGLPVVDGDCVIVQSARQAAAAIGIFGDLKLASGVSIISICPLSESHTPTYLARTEDCVCARLFQLQRTFIK